MCSRCGCPSSSPGDDSKNSSASPPSLSPFFYKFRAAVALNNVAVSLLEQGSFRQANDTLRDALFVVKGLVVSGPQNSCKTTLHHHDDDNTAAEDKMLHLASRRLAESTQRIVAASSSNGRRSAPRFVHSRTVAHDHQDYYLSTLHSILSCCEEQQRQQEQQPQQPDMIPVRMEPSAEDGRGLLDGGGDVESALILNNFGISYLGMAEQLVQQRRESSTSANRLRQQALKVFGSCYCILQQAYEKGCCGSFSSSSRLAPDAPCDDDDEEGYYNRDDEHNAQQQQQQRRHRWDAEATERAEYLLLNIFVVVNNMVRTLRDLGRSAEAIALFRSTRSDYAREILALGWEEDYEEGYYEDSSSSSSSTTSPSTTASNNSRQQRHHHHNRAAAAA